MPTKDPRSYIQRMPLPVASQRGVKIQARCDKVYNPTQPSREIVRKVNYSRRHEQLTGQGFNALNYKPYIGIGDPFYLDERRLILSALGQLDESDDSYYTTSEDEDDLQKADTLVPKSMTAAKFMLRRKKRDLNNLSKEVHHGRTLIRNVKLGHGLFDLIRQERSAKKQAIAEAYRRKAEEARNSWQPPKSDSSSEEDSDNELPPELDSQGSSRPNSSKSTSHKKKKNIPPRPFTPKYTSLSEVTDHTQDFENNINNSLAPTRDSSPESRSVVPIDPDALVVKDETFISFDVSRDSLFRQLCVLNWLLEAMNLEQGYTMAPITTCWKLTKNDLGGNKISNKKLQREKTAQTHWDQFVTNTGPHARMSKKSSGARLSRQYTSKRVHVRSSTLSPSNSSTSLTNQMPHHLHAPPTLLEDTMVTVQESEEDETPISRSIFKFLDEYYASIRLPDGTTDPNTIDIYSGTRLTDNRTGHRQSRQEKSISEGRSSRRRHRSKSSDRKISKDSRVQSAKSSITDEQRRTSRLSMNNSKIIRPKSSPGLIEYQAKLPSNKYYNLSVDLRNKFEDIQEDKALTLHDLLQQIERDRLIKCQNKFSALKTGTSIWSSLDKMREEGYTRHQTTEQLRKKSSFKGNWFTDLQESIPKQLKDFWYYKQILNKLGKYGLIENATRQSPYPFIKALSTLRDWEICSPDVTAAIEFCREKIVDMTIDEFEEWFQQQFPMVTRPPTVSPTPKSKEQKDQLIRATLQSSQSSRPATTNTSTSKHSSATSAAQ